MYLKIAGFPNTIMIKISNLDFSKIKDIKFNLKEANNNFTITIIIREIQAKILKIKLLMILYSVTFKNK